MLERTLQSSQSFAPSAVALSTELCASAEHQTYGQTLALDGIPRSWSPTAGLQAGAEYSGAALRSCLAAHAGPAAQRQSH